MRITTIGLDLAKRVFQAHGVDETGAIAPRSILGRDTALAVGRHATAGAWRIGSGRSRRSGNTVDAD
ncbi:MAG: hypothetical protein EOS77_28920 [Mesorhizobium sp.]|nr:MAG: hypothetical protein EOS77_28920 [Mesorhizobium sp.]